MDKKLPGQKMNSNKFRFFIGPGDIGNWGMLLKRYLSENGHSVEHVLASPPPKRRDYAEYDKCLNLRDRNRATRLMISAIYLIKILFTKDVIIFPAGVTFFRNKRTSIFLWLELGIYRLFRLEIIPIFVGCDLRHYESAEEYALKLGTSKWHGCQFCPDRSSCSYKLKKNLAQAYERFAGPIFVHSEGRFFFRKKHHPIRLMFDLDAVKCNIPKTDPIRILHAPSRKEKKGTDRIMKVLDKIKESYGDHVEIKLLYEIPNSQVLEELENGHILVSQIAFYDLGQVGLEGMAAGTVLMASSLRSNDEIPEFSNDCPAVFVNFDTLEEKLRWYIAHPAEIQKKAIEGRTYVEAYHDYRKVGHEILQLISSHYTVPHL